MSKRNSRSSNSPAAQNRPTGSSALRDAAFRAAATIGGCGEMFPKVSQSSLMFPNVKICGTNPLSAGVAAPAKPSIPSYAPIPRNEPKPATPDEPAGTPQMFPKVSQSSLLFPNVKSDGTKPIASEPTLTDRQRAAARLLAAGRRVTDVATELKLTRQSITRWKRQANFCALIAQEHAQQTRAAGEAAARRGARPRY